MECLVVSCDRLLPFEHDDRIDPRLVTPLAGVPGLIEVFRMTGAAGILDREISFKKRRRGLMPSELVQSLFCLVAAGGDTLEDMNRLREDKALAKLLGHDLPAARTARDFLEPFHDETADLVHDGVSKVPAESQPLVALAKANTAMIGSFAQARPSRVATIDIDATIIDSTKRAARRTYEGERGYQPVIALWAEHDLILADEFRDGNVPAHSGNRRVVEKALAALPSGGESVLLRADSALYEHDLMEFLDERAVGYCISAMMSPQLRAQIEALGASHWHEAGREAGAVRHWAEVNYLPDDGIYNKDAVSPRRYLAIRVTPMQGELFDTERCVRHYCIVTNRSDPPNGTGLDLIRWHRGKAGTVEQAHDVLCHELAAAALPSQRFGVNAAWFRLNTLLFNLISLYKRIGLDDELHTARPKRLRFLVFAQVGHVITHARSTLLRWANALARNIADRARTRSNTQLHPLAAV